MMKKKKMLGSLELPILITVKESSYVHAFPLRERLKSAGLGVGAGTFYTTINRLWGKSFLKTTTTASVSRRGGRRKSAYTLTKEGLKSLEYTLGVVDKLRESEDDKIDRYHKLLQVKHSDHMSSSQATELKKVDHELHCIGVIEADKFDQVSYLKSQDYQLKVGIKKAEALLRKLEKSKEG